METRETRFEPGSAGPEPAEAWARWAARAGRWLPGLLLPSLLVAVPAHANLLANGHFDSDAAHWSVAALGNGTGSFDPAHPGSGHSGAAGTLTEPYHWGPKTDGQRSPRWPADCSTPLRRLSWLSYFRTGLEALRRQSTQGAPTIRPCIACRMGPLSHFVRWGRRTHLASALASSAFRRPRAIAASSRPCRV